MGLKLMAEIGLDGSGFERGLHHIGQEAARSVKNLAVEAFGIYGIEQAIAKTVETATDLVNESKRLDVTVEQLQLLRQAAKDGGTEMGTLASAFEKLDIARAKALSGDAAAMTAFTKLGVSKDDLKTQTAATLFTNQISGAVKGGNVESLAPVLREVLGKGFGEIIPVLKTDFDELGDKMKRLGSIMDTETAVKLKALSDNFDLLKNILATQLGPVLLSFLEALIPVIGKIKELSAFIGALVAGGWKKAAKDFWTAHQARKTIVGHDAAQAMGLPDNAESKSKFEEAKKFLEEYDEKVAEAGKAAIDAGSAFDKMVQGIREKLQKEADDLSHPKPINPDVGLVKAKKLHAIASDSLIKVGNFLGANGNTISRVDQRKISLMEKHLHELKGINLKLGGNFALGIPHI